jgi:hypothetical protein
MLAIRFVPNRVNIDTRLTRLQNRLELGSSLMREPVTGAKGVFLDFHVALGGRWLWIGEN